MLSLFSISSFYFNKPSYGKYASIIMNEKSGKVYHSINADTRNYPASLTKIMTIYMIFEKLKNKKIKMNTKLKVSKRASRQPPSKLGLYPGQKITVKQAILALVTKSANDVATVVAENFEEITLDYLIFGVSEVKKDKIKASNDLFSYQEIDNTKDSVKESNNRVKSIIIIYENNKFEQIDRL